MALLRGDVAVESPSGQPLAVVLFAEEDGRFEAIDLFPLREPGPYFFTVLPGRYRISAFEDEHDDLIFRGSEPFGHALGARPIEVEGDHDRDGLDIVVGSAAAPPLEAPIDALSVWSQSARSRANFAEGRSASGGSLAEVGSLVEIDDPRFSYENARLGLWEPIQFLSRVGWGIYFLEAYDPAKTPVLFVHGVLGFPRQWEYIVRHLDRSRFQPWLVFDPTGFGLERLGTRLAIELEMLQRAYAFDQIVVVAHSMGGLVSREMIEELERRGGAEALRLYVTFSTPWNGAPAAGWAPAPPPGFSFEEIRPFYDSLEPDSPFLTQLLASPLPKQMPYYLFYGTDDHTVARESVLDPRATKAAREVFSFPATHVGILSNRAAVQKLHRILAETDGPP